MKIHRDHWGYTLAGLLVFGILTAAWTKVFLLLIRKVAVLTERMDAVPSTLLITGVSIVLAAGFVAGSILWFGLWDYWRNKESE